MDKNKDKVNKTVSEIDTNNNGRISKRELKTYLNKQIKDGDKVIKAKVAKPVKAKEGHTMLRCPNTGNQYTVCNSELDNFYLILNADDTWRI